MLTEALKKDIGAASSKSLIGYLLIGGIVVCCTYLAPGLAMFLSVIPILIIYYLQDRFVAAANDYNNLSDQFLRIVLLSRVIFWISFSLSILVLWQIKDLDFSQGTFSIGRQSAVYVFFAFIVLCIGQALQTAVLLANVHQAEVGPGMVATPPVLRHLKNVTFMTQFGISLCLAIIVPIVLSVIAYLASGGTQNENQLTLLAGGMWIISPWLILAIPAAISPSIKNLCHNQSVSDNGAKAMKRALSSSVAVGILGWIGIGMATLGLIGQSEGSIEVQMIVATPAFVAALLLLTLLRLLNILREAQISYRAANQSS